VTDSVPRLALDGWRLGVRAIVRMPGLGATTFLILAACEMILELIGAPAGSDLSSGLIFVTDVIVEIVEVVKLFVVASALIAVHRFVVLGEVADRPVWRIPPGYGRFVGWLICLDLLALPLEALEAYLGPVDYSFVVVSVSLLYLIFLAVVSLRLMLLFPGLALGAPSADWRGALSDSRGHAWKFLGVQALTCAPIFVVVLPFMMWFRHVRPPLDGMLFLTALGESASTLFWWYLSAVAASRLFQNYAAALTGQIDGAFTQDSG
jgi:hypothetical protein